MLFLTILCKNGTGDKGTNGKAVKNGTLILNFPKLQTQIPTLKPQAQTQTHIPKPKPPILNTQPPP